MSLSCHNIIFLEADITLVFLMVAPEMMIVYTTALSLSLSVANTGMLSLLQSSCGEPVGVSW